jgi:hypothetical protein
LQYLTACFSAWHGWRGIFGQEVGGVVNCLESTS